jgi:uncharacterized protein (UPF0264 family)
MTQLLVSVRDAAEAREAVMGGADVVDVKEPSRGSLGAADPEVWQDIFRQVPENCPTSVALGELLERSCSERVRQLPSVQYAKVGLAGCRHVSNWRQRWATLTDDLPQETGPVAVIYADADNAEAPEPLEIIRTAVDLSCQAVLFDTHGKKSGWLLDHIHRNDLRQMIQLIRDAGLMVVLAGSITLPRLDHVLELNPDLVAVRGAACVGSRTGRVCRDLVRQLVERLRCPATSSLSSKTQAAND